MSCIRAAGELVEESRSALVRFLLMACRVEVEQRSARSTYDWASAAGWCAQAPSRGSASPCSAASGENCADGLRLKPSSTLGRERCIHAPLSSVELLLPLRA